MQPFSEFQFLQTTDFEDVGADEEADDLDFAGGGKAGSFSLDRWSANICKSVLYHS